MDKKVLFEGKEVEYLCNYHDNGQINMEWTESMSGLHGYSRRYYPNGQLKSECKYYNNQKKEIDNEWFEDGSVKKVVEYDSINNEYIRKEFFPNGNLKGEQTVNSDLKKIGKSITYFENGQIQQIYYSDEFGNSIGEHSIYFPNGNKQTEGVYKSGQYYLLNLWTEQQEHLIIDGFGTVKTFDKEGNLSLIEEYKNGLRNGEAISYKKGKLNYTAFYVDGKSQGATTYYYPNGKVKEIVHMKDGIMTHAERDFPMFDNPIVEKSIEIKPSPRRDDNNALISIKVFPTLTNKSQIINTLNVTPKAFEGRPQERKATEVYRVTLTPNGKVSDFTRSTGSGYDVVSAVESSFASMEFDMHNQTIEGVENQIWITFCFWLDEKNR